MKETVLLVDGDLLCFRAAAAIEKRSVIVKHNPTGKEKEFDTRTAFRKAMKEKFGDKWPEKEIDYTFTDVQTADALPVALHNIKSRIDKFKTEFGTYRAEFYLGGSDTFRSKLLLPSLYKGQREDTLRPVHLIEARDYVERVHKGVVVKDIEADDMLSIRAYEELAKRDDPVICSMDKDTYQADGIKVYNWLDVDSKPIKVPFLGTLRETGKKQIKGEGFRFFAFQLLAGDPVDFYRPTEVAGIRYGAKSAYKDLVDLPDAPSIASKVISKYKEWYPGEVQYTAWNGVQVKTDWEGMLDLYFKCAYMLRSKNDTTTWQEFFIERGWNGKQVR